MGEEISMRRAFLYLAALLAACTASVAAQQLAAGPPEPDWKPTEIKNLTVLPKETSPDDVMKIMRAWNAALGVDCVFCHVGQVGKPLSTFDFASDNKKRKDVSRTMAKAAMAMNETFKTIESDDPIAVQCSTCHKRSRHVDADLPPEKPKGEQHD
jgi:cytochrome c553